MILLLRVPSSGDRVGAIDPPISQGLIAAAAIARGVDARLLDLTYAGQTGVDDLTSALGDTGLRVVGMSTYQSNIERCLAIARLVKTLRPDVKVLLGGPQATHMPAAGLTAMADVDGLCRGAGEGVLVDYASGRLSYHAARRRLLWHFPRLLPRLAMVAWRGRRARAAYNPATPLHG